MNKTSSVEQISRTGNLDATLKLRQHKLELTARFMEIKSFNPKKKKKGDCKGTRLFKFFITTF